MHRAVSKFCHITFLLNVCLLLRIVIITVAPSQQTRGKCMYLLIRKGVSLFWDASFGTKSEDFTVGCKKEVITGNQCSR